jgi:hypothetical protein
MSTALPARIFTFTSVEVYLTPENEKIVEWKVNSRFEFKTSTVVFHVEIARAAGEWTRITTVPIQDTCVFLDTDQHRCSIDSDIYYRVIADDGTCEYPSPPAHTMGEMPRHDRVMAREILRKEYLRMRKTSAGTLGQLLRRREHGTRCTSCVDFDLDEPVGSFCTECFGTGFKRGYYNAIPYYMDVEVHTSKKDVKEPLGLQDNQAKMARCVAFPRISTYDIWVHTSANLRFVIREVASVAEMRSIPLIYKVQIRPLPVSDIVYQVPMDQTEDVPVDCEADTESGWRQGIAYDEVF